MKGYVYNGSLPHYKEDFLKIHLVTGKGGVGKSTLASVFAMDLAGRGKRVLLVELGTISEFSQIFQMPVGFQPQQIRTNLYVSQWTGRDCLREFLTHYLRLPKIVKFFFDNRVMGAFLKAAPALNELSILGKITSGVRGVGSPMDYDEIVVDAYSTGHCRALLNAPKGMGHVVSGGPMGRESESILKVVLDPAVFSIYVISISEEMPVVEAIETYHDLRKEWGITAKVILNKVYPDLCSRIDEMEKDSLSERQGAFLDDVKSHISCQEKALDQFRQESIHVTIAPMGFGGGVVEKINNLRDRVQWSHSFKAQK